MARRSRTKDMQRRTVEALYRAMPLNPHGPDADVRAASTLREIPTNLDDIIHMGLVGADTVRRYWLGECSVIVSHTKEFGWHLSIANGRRYPTWDEISEARYRLLPDAVTMAMLLPPRAEFVNIHRFVFQLTELETSTPKDAS
jgi:hypothetical protein